MQNQDVGVTPESREVPWGTFQAGIGIAAIGIIAYCFRFSSSREAVSVASTALLVAGAAFAAGSFIGFLFGIPRAPRDDGSGGSSFSRNTSLEQISDWLTKLLVGAGLTQIGQLPEQTRKLTEHLSEGLGNDDPSGVFALAMIIYFALFGFLITYLWTSINLYKLLSGDTAKKFAELGQEIKQVKEDAQNVKVVSTAIKVQAASEGENNALAFKLVENQLSPSRDVPSPTIDDLRLALGQASEAVRTQIFVRAQNVRSENWRTDRPRMELTIPIFQALLDTGSDKDHAVRGQLGFALKDKVQPDWSGAERELSAAIERRAGERGWLFYEFNRAICRIMQDDSFSKGQPSVDAIRDRVIDDLRAAATADFLLELITNGEGRLLEWMKLNGLTIADLTK